MRFWKDKAVLVTGGTGFVGSHFVLQLLEAGAKVSVPIHRREPKAWKPGEVKTFLADLEDPQACRKALAGQEIVIHAAGAVSAAGVTTGSNPLSPITANLILTANVLEAAWAVQSERILIFGSSTGYPETNHPVTEDEMWSGSPHPSYFGYGWMRRYLEKMAEFTQLRGGRGIALVRPTATYGPFDDFDPKTSHVIPALIRRAVLKETPFEVWGTGKEERDFLYIEDLVRGALLVLEKHAVCDPVNIGYGEATTIGQIVEQILKLTGHHTDPIFRADRPTTIPKRLVNCAKAMRILGFKPQTSLEEGLKRTIDYYRAERESSK